MGYQVLESVWLAPNVRKLVVSAPHVTRNCGPGQFVIVRATPDGERIPLTIGHADRQQGCIHLFIQAIGKTTTDLCSIERGGSLCDVAGPMGKKTHIQRVGHAVIVGGGVGTAVIYPQARALKEQGNTVSAIMGGRSKPYVILETELRAICDAVYPCTDDGSYGFHGFVTQRLQQLIADSAASNPVKEVITAGPVPMMRAVAEVTRPHGIHTMASLNPIMVDGTGMCGGCRVIVGGKQRFACVHGPDFDAHEVDFTNLLARQKQYLDHEKAAVESCAGACHK